MIAIKDMEMPKSCSECGLKEGSYCYFKKPPYNFNGFNILKGRHPNCPLTEIVTCKDCTYDGCAKAHSPNHWCADAERK